jgi:hypothetical protein
MRAVMRTIAFVLVLAGPGSGLVAAPANAQQGYPPPNYQQPPPN